MSETYEIETINGILLDVDKNTNEIHFAKSKSDKPRGKYTQQSQPFIVMIPQNI